MWCQMEGCKHPLKTNIQFAGCLRAAGLTEYAWTWQGPEKVILSSLRQGLSCSTPPEANSGDRSLWKTCPSISPEGIQTVCLQDWLFMASTVNKPFQNLEVLSRYTWALRRKPGHHSGLLFICEFPLQTACVHFEV